MSHQSQLKQLVGLIMTAGQVMSETPADSRKHIQAAVARQQFLIAMAIEVVEVCLDHKGKLTKGEQQILDDYGEDILTALKLVKCKLYPLYSQLVEASARDARLRQAADDYTN